MSQKTFELGRMDIIDLYEWEGSGKLETGPYFQRESVWKEKDRIELIDTILKGFPIPAVFFCEGGTNLDTFKKQYYILDGKQRLESIFKFIKNEFKYEGKKFGELSDEKKEAFSSYSIPVVQIYVNPKENKDEIIEIFRRLNKNSYSLNKIEKEMAEYNSHEFISLCKIMTNYETVSPEELSEYLEEMKNIEVDDENEISIEETPVSLENSLNTFVTTNNFNSLNTLYSSREFFSEFQIRRQIPLQHLINAFGTLILGEHVNRNLKKEYFEEFSKYEKFEIVTEKALEIESAASIFQDVFTDDIDKWWKIKTNLYSFLVFFSKNLKAIKEMDVMEIKRKINVFKDTPDFESYRALCQERVNDRPNRIKREEIIEKIILG